MSRNPNYLEKKLYGKYVGIVDTSYQCPSN